MKLNIPLLIIILVLGLGVLGSYIPIFLDSYKNTSDPYWVMSKSQRVPYYIFILLAVFGFLTFAVYYLNDENKPDTGLLSKNSNLELIMGSILLFSILWSVFIYLSVNKGDKVYKILCFISLLAVALSSVLLFIGIMQDKNAPAYVIAAIILFCTVTVLSDAIGWNTKFIATF
jgi:hypothetical protein